MSSDLHWGLWSLRQTLSHSLGTQAKSKHLSDSIATWVWPNNEKNFTWAFVITGVVILRNGMASGNLVEAYIMVSKNWFPVSVLGNGPTQSTIIFKRLTHYWNRAEGRGRWRYHLIWFSNDLTHMKYDNSERHRIWVLAKRNVWRLFHRF